MSTRRRFPFVEYLARESFMSFPDFVSQEHLDWFKEYCQPLVPKPTSTTPVLPTLEGIRCVTFDIYGTLIISASGDIGSQSIDKAELMKEAFERVGLETKGLEGTDSTSLLTDHIKAHHEVRVAQGSLHPEVEIREVWADLCYEVGTEATPQQITDLAFVYETLVNPVWSMPNLEYCLKSLQEQQLTLAIVSNAQFYTALLFEIFTGKSLDAWGFSTHRVWSFEHREAKPNADLYRLLAQQLQHHERLKPEQVLYVGNDMRNDIWPADQVGFRTALFAGDARSLRLREEHPEASTITPTATLTDLQQLPTLLT